VAKLLGQTRPRRHQIVRGVKQLEELEVNAARIGR